MGNYKYLQAIKAPCICLKPIDILKSGALRRFLKYLWDIQSLYRMATKANAVSDYANFQFGIKFFKY